MLFHRGSPKLRPQICNTWEKVAANYPAGTEVELDILFADIRGSATPAEGLAPRADRD